MRVVSIACALVLATISVASAQDPATVDANHYKVLIDNERTRVFRVMVGPGEKVPMHEHPDAIMIPLSIPAPAVASTRAAGFLRAQKHGGDNPGTVPIDFIYIELKGAVPTAVTVPLNQLGAVTGTRLVEHPKADAILVTAATGASEPSGATHDYDKVIVALGDAELSLTIDGKTTNTWKRGEWPSSAATSGTSRRTTASRPSS